MQKKILVVDDSLSIRKMVGFSLESGGYSVVTAEDGLIALERLAGDEFDAIILDINMPRLDGFELLEKIKSGGACSVIPVIVLTTEGQEEDRAKAFSLGAEFYLVKPFKPTELLGTVDGIFSLSA